MDLAVFDGRFRSGVDRVVRPAGKTLSKVGLSPDQLTAAGLVLALPAAWSIATGRLGLGLGLLIGSAVPDLFDGALAKASGRATSRGAFFDSVADRIADTLVLGGVAWYLLDRYGGHIALLPMGVLGVSLLVSYERAKAESLGFSAKGGLMERAERIVVLCAGLAWSFLLVPFLWVMLGLTTVTAIQRFIKVWSQASAAGSPGVASVHRPALRPQPALERRARAWTRELALARWRAWREESRRYSGASRRPSPRPGVGGRGVGPGREAARLARRRGRRTTEP